MVDLTCVVAASDEIVREGLRAVLSGLRSCRYAGQASSLPRLLAMCRRRPPDLLVLDTRLPSSEKENALRIVREAFPGTIIIALLNDVGQHCAGDDFASAVPDATAPCCAEVDCLGQALDDGADEVILLSASRAEVLRAARTMISEDPRGIEGVPHGAPPCEARRNANLRHRPLTPRERQVATLVAQGLCNKEIASRLGIHSTTVKKHIGQVLIKLDLRDRLQIALRVTGEMNADFADRPERSRGAPTSAP